MKKKPMILLISLCLFLIAVPLSRGQTSPDDDTFTMVLTGDCIITRRLSVYEEPEYVNMMEIIRSADAAFTNLEMLFHDYEPFPMHQSGGTYMRADPFLAKELVWAGIDMVSRANNHTGDYGVLGMRLTTQYTEEAGLVHAGVGESLAEAREAKFLETSKARVALISCASTYPDHARAGKSRDDIPSRPGLNPLRYATICELPEEDFKTLRKMFKAIGFRMREDEDEFSFYGRRFKIGEQTTVHTNPDPEDLEEITAVVRNARRLADCTLVTFHGHESDKDRTVPAEFLIEFSRAMIEAGADVVAGHGPHVLRGIEIYKGKPILYSLGNFVFQNETLLRLPHENYEPYDIGPDAHVADFNDARYDHDKRGFPAKPEYWESVIAVPAWKEGKLIELKLYPITLGHGQPRTVRGRPMLADRRLGEKIIEDLKRLSEPFGTTIEFEDGVGLVKLQR